jgi:hypothetical protein
MAIMELLPDFFILCGRRGFGRSVGDLGTGRKLLNFLSQQE